MPQTGSQLRLPLDTTSLAPSMSSNGNGNGNGNGNSHIHGHGQTHDYGGGSEDESSESSPLDSSAFFSRVRRKPVSTSPTRLSVDQAPLRNKTYHPVINAVRSVDDEYEGHVQESKNKKKLGRGPLSGICLWKWELVSLFISAVSFVGIIIVLRIYQDRTLSSWRIPLSINAIVAVLSAVFKGSLGLPITEGISQLKWLWFSSQPRSLADMDMYDKASRGPWGSFLFVTRQFARRQRSYLASLGAFIAIVTLATDPFSQAAVSLKSCLMPISLQARIPIANRYVEVGPVYAARSNVLDAPMQYAVYRALLEPPANSSQSVKVDCTTGNCTFPADQGATFTTLSMCHSCRDISNTIRYNNASGVSAHELPNGLSVHTPPMHLSTTASISSDGYPDGSWPRTNLVDIQALALVDRDAQCAEKSDCAKAPLAFECSLRPCVRTYGANYTNGVYREEELSRAHLHFVPGSVRYRWEVAMNRTVYNGTWKDCQGTELRSEKNTAQVALPEIRQGDKNSWSFPSLWYPPECVYTISGMSSNALADFIVTLFTKQNVVSGPTQWGLFGPFWHQNLYKAGKMNMSSINAWADGLSLSIGAQMRNVPDADEPDMLKQVHGQSFRNEVCIRVEWKFLSFLAVLIGLELLFAVTVIVLNHRSPWDGNWKSSSLALVFQNLGPPEPASKEGMAPGSEQALAAAAEPMNVSLSRVEGRWQLAREGDL